MPFTKEVDCSILFMLLAPHIVSSVFYLRFDQCTIFTIVDAHDYYDQVFATNLTPGLCLIQILTRVQP